MEGDDGGVEAAARLLGCGSVQELLAAAMEAGLARHGAAAAMVYTVQDDGWLQAAAVVGYDEADAADYRWIPPDSPYPVAVAVRERRPVHQQVDLPRGGAASFAAFPLTVAGRCCGVLLLELRRAVPLPPGSYAAVTAVATVCAYRLAVLDGHGGRAPEVRQPPAYGARPADSRASRMEQALTSAGVGTFEWNIPAGTVVWDERVCRMYGIDPREFDGRIETFAACVHPKDRTRVDQAIEASLTSGQYAIVYRVLHPDGAVRWIDVKGRIRYDAERRPLAMSGVALDRTVDEERRRLVATATDAFASALRVQDVVDVMAQEILPLLRCSALAIHLLVGEDLVLRGADGYPQEALGRLGLAGRHGTPSPMAHALATGEPLLLEDRRSYEQQFPAPAVRPAPHHQAWAVLPLRTANGPIGTCVMSYPVPHVFTEEDTSQLSVLAGILSQSLARATMFEQRRRQMTELQAMMLPRTLRAGPGAAVAVRYLPATEGLDVGGDFYDVVPLAGGRTGLVIGDVQGHSVRAAAVMGQIRTALRAYAAQNSGPVAVMEAANRLLCDLDTDLFATACYAELDPAAGRALIVRAGHPQPLAIRADGTAEEVVTPGGLPLGIDPDAGYPVHEAAVGPCEALMFCTDGLVERRDTEYGQEVAGLVRELTAVTRDLVGHGTTVPDVLELLADHLIARPPRPGMQDDIAVLFAARQPPPTDPGEAAGAG